MKIIDLSVPLEDESTSDPEPWRPKINYSPDHREGAEDMRKMFDVDPDDLVTDGFGWAFEEVKAITHSGTHLDAPWHFYPTSEGEIAKTIDQVPLDWCFSDGVVLDVRDKEPGEIITVKDLKQALKKIDYSIKPFDIILIMTGRDKFIGTPKYFEQPGMGRESTLWLLEKGVKIIGIDAYGFDRSFDDMAQEYKETGDGGQVWQAHFAGKEKEYCHIEKLANLDKIPDPYGFKVACFPVKISKASAGWCRAVAIIDG